MFDVLQDAPLRASFDFIIKVDALKKVLRHTSVIKNERRENTAEHSWHLALMAVVLKKYANTDVKLERVIKMLLVHDLGELDVPDYNLYDPARASAHDAEKAAVEILFSPLAKDLRDELMSLWIEFSEGKTNEASFARALDRFQPFLSNIANGGGSWKDLQITKNKALEKNAHIAEGSEKLWNAYETLADELDRCGLFHKSVGQ